MISLTWSSLTASYAATSSLTAQVLMEAPNTRSASVLSPSVTATLRMLSPQRMTFMLLEASQPAQARAQVPTFSTTSGSV